MCFFYFTLEEVELSFFEAKRIIFGRNSWKSTLYILFLLQNDCIAFDTYFYVFIGFKIYAFAFYGRYSHK